MILWLTLAELGSGLLLMLWAAPRREVGDSFGRFLAVLSAAALAPLAGACSGPVRWLALGATVGAAAGGLLGSWGLGAAGATLARVAALPAAAALVGAVLPYRRPGPATAAQGWALGIDALTSAALLGSITGAMILGHWYLVNERMPIAPLRRVSAAIGAAALAKAAVGIGVLWFYGWPGSRSGLALSLLLPPGLFYVVRVGFGIAGPLAIAPMVWHTAKLHATQSATGILYVAVVLALVGETTANALMTRTPFPF
jgi:hypothetical protein